MIVLASPRPSDARFAEAAATAFNLAPVIWRDPRAARTVPPGAAPVYLVRVEKAEDEAAWTGTDGFGAWTDGDANRIIFLTDREPSELAGLREPGAAGGWIGLSGGATAEAAAFVGRAFGRILRLAREKNEIVWPAFFGEAVEATRWSLTSSREKASVLAELQARATSMGFPVRQLGDVLNAADELMMNAIFDAPVDVIGGRIYRNVLRSESVALVGKGSVVVDLVGGRASVGVTASDEFGSLERTALWRRLSASYRDAEYTVEEDNPSAGLGLAQILRAGGSLSLICQSSAFTRASAWYTKLASRKALPHWPRFVLVQVFGEAAAL